jgi:hypothetical protein
MHPPDGSPSRVTLVSVLTRYRVLPCFVALHSIGCGGDLSPAPPPATNTADGECDVPEPRPIPQRNDCAVTAQACEPGQGCVFTPLSETLRPLLLDSCDVYCGELEVGATNACITRVENPTGNVGNLECVRQLLLGTRWECAPNEGMARVYLGSCTIR